MSESNRVKRTYESYMRHSDGYGDECYYRLVANEFRKLKERRGDDDAKLLSDTTFRHECYHNLLTDETKKAQRDKLNAEFREFDDSFLKQLAGLPPDAPLPLKSNEVFDSRYEYQVISLYYQLGDRNDVCYLPGIERFLRHVKSGNLEPYSQFFEREYDTEKVGGILFANNMFSLIKYDSFRETESHYAIPEGVTYIEKGAFSTIFDNCRLTSVTIPSSVTEIGPEAFREIAEIYIDGDNPAYKIVDGVLFNRDISLLHTYIGSNARAFYQIPDGVQYIEESAFSQCSNLVGVGIPDSIIEIGTKAFYYCKGISSLVLPKGVARIGTHAFCFCGNLESVVIPDSVEYIGARVFSGCDRLTVSCSEASYAHEYCVDNDYKFTTAMK